MNRTAFDHLQQWRNDPDRRVLLVRGARQVGKTYVVRALGKTFTHYIEANFEENRSLRTFFQGDLDIEAICRNISAFYKTPVVDGETLLFLDEIQACPDASVRCVFFTKSDRRCTSLRQAHLSNSHCRTFRPSGSDALHRSISIRSRSGNFSPQSMSSRYGTVSSKHQATGRCNRCFMPACSKICASTSS